MKKIYKIAGILLSILILGTSCDPADKFLDPEQTTSGDVGGLFTATINNVRLRTEYWHVRTFAYEQSARYTQAFYLPNGRDQYKQTDGYIRDYWREFYTPESRGPMALYRQMQNVNKGLAEEQQTANEIFFQAGKVILYDYAVNMIDVFGDIPFSEAGSLHTSNQIIPAKFDDQKELYTTLIDDLEKIALYFKTAKTTNAFSKQDILLSGNIAMWEKYANSLRLRMLIHMSYSDEAYAKDKIMKVINNPSQYPLIDGNNNANYTPSTSDVLNVPLSTFSETLREMFDGNGSVAPDFMVNNVMVPVKDPRLAVMFDKNGKAEYKAIPINTQSEIVTSIRTDYSCWDSTTFWFNKNLPGVRMTAPEVNLIIAEAQERWGNTDKAKEAFELAVKQSVTFYYYLNSTSPSVGSGFRYEAKPSDTDINDFVGRLKYAGSKESKLELIGTQKWLHLNWLQSIECWTEYRRTKYPKLLPFPSEAINPLYPTPPTRLTYPSEETAYNPNYKDVAAKDTRTTKIFWDVK